MLCCAVLRGRDGDRIGWPPYGSGALWLVPSTPYLLSHGCSWLFVYGLCSCCSSCRSIRQAALTLEEVSTWVFLRGRGGELLWEMGSGVEIGVGWEGGVLVTGWLAGIGGTGGGREEGRKEAWWLGELEEVWDSVLRF